MSQLHARIQEDIKAAMRAQQKDRLSVLRMLHSAVKDLIIEKRAGVDDAEVTKVLLSYAKKREEAMAEASKAQRDDLVAKERFELEVVRSYLPTPLSDAELEALVAKAVSESGATSIKDMGAVMKLAVAKAEGRADGSRISAAVKRRLGGAA
jgi:uncharacterized protein YqeY